MESHLSNMGLSTQVQKTGGYSHPYETELRTLSYNAEQLEVAKEQLPKSLEEVKYASTGPREQRAGTEPSLRRYLWVDTPEKLQQLVAVLATQKEIAIDLEVGQNRPTKVSTVGSWADLSFAAPRLQNLSGPYLLDANLDKNRRLHCGHAGAVEAHAHPGGSVCQPPNRQSPLLPL